MGKNEWKKHNLLISCLFYKHSFDNKYGFSSVYIAEEGIYSQNGNFTKVSSAVAVASNT